MRTIHKYAIPLQAGATSLSLPKSAVVRLVHSYGRSDLVHVWFELDSGAIRTERFFIVTGTGVNVPDDAEWRGSCVSPVGLVWHVWEVS